MNTNNNYHSYNSSFPDNDQNNILQDDKKKRDYKDEELERFQIERTIIISL